MERPRLVPQLYGYAVCLVSVITMLIATGHVIEGVFDSATPEMSRDVESTVGGSFEMYKQRRMERAPSRSPDGVITTQLPADSVLRPIYEDERRYRIAAAKYHGIRKIVGGLVILLLGGTLFALHWRWLRRITQTESA